LDEKVYTEKGIPAFGFSLRRLSKKEIPCVEKKNLPPFLFHLGNKSGFLGHTAKRVSESPARLDFTHHIVCVDDAELNFGCGLVERINK